MPRQAFISPLQHFLLLASNSAINEFLIDQGLASRDLTPFVYTSLIQSGVDQLAFTNGANLPADLAPYLNRRIVRHETPSYFEVNRFVSELLRTSAIEERGKSPPEMTYLWAFLTVFLHALQFRRPMVTFMKPFEAAGFIPYLQPEVAAPIANLITSLKPLTLDVAAPVTCISVKEAALLEEILNDVAFKPYKQQHAVLECCDASVSSTSTRIAKESKKVIQRHRILRLERLGTWTLDLSAKFIDTVLGGIPGKLGTELVTHADKFLHERQRIVFYQYTDLFPRIAAHEIS